MTDERMPRQIGVRLRDEEIEQLRRVAEEEGRTMSGQARYWISRALKEQEHRDRAA